MTINQQLNANEARRLAAESRYIDRMDKRFYVAESMLGQLIRNGKPVWYVCPIGGKYREGTRVELIDFLIRNKYA